MATKISQLPTDSAVTGVELLTGIDGSTNKNISVQQISDFAKSKFGITSLAFTGTTTKTLTVTYGDGTTATATFTDMQGSGGTVDLSTPTEFDGTIRLDVLNRTATVDAADITDPITFDATDAADGAGYTLGVIADGVTAEPDVTDFVELENPVAYDTTSGNATAYIFNRVLGVNVVGRIKLGVLPAGDTTPPELTGVSVEDSTPTIVDFAFDEALAPGFVPLASDFTVSGHTTTGTVTITGSVVHVPVTVAFTAGETRTAAYTPGLTANKLQDASGNLVVAFSGEAIDDNVGLITPAAPTSFGVNDTTNEATWVDSAGYTLATDYEYRIGGIGSFTGATVKPINVGNISIPVGDMEIRVKAVVGVSNPSASLTNGTAFKRVLTTPTSFAAGTPTSDGVPFTWVDPSDTPNESSFLIQITTTADTGYASVVTTRTPAANATSEAAGTGLTASTGYRARIKKVGNGTSTLDSAYSSEVTFTTAAGSSRQPVIFTTVSNIATTTPSTTWEATGGGSSTYGNTGIDDTNQIIGAGDLYMEVSGNQAAFIGLSSSSSMVGYSGMGVSMGLTSTGVDAYAAEGATLGSTHDVTGATGLRIHKTGTGPYVYKLQKTSDYVSWTDVVTYSVTTDLTYIVTDISGVTFNGKMVNPEFE